MEEEGSQCSVLQRNCPEWRALLIVTWPRRLNNRRFLRPASSSAGQKTHESPAKIDGLKHDRGEPRAWHNDFARGNAFISVEDHTHFIGDEMGVPHLN